MPKCEQCQKKISLLESIFRSDWLCKACSKIKEKQEAQQEKARQIREEKLEKVSSILEEHGIYATKEGGCVYPRGEYEHLFLKKDIGFEVNEKAFNILVDELVKTNLDEKAITKFYEACVKDFEKKKIIQRQKRLELKHDAEKEFFGKVKTKRVPITEEQKEAIFEKFNHSCTICGAQEGLHIHHKDHNPSNNNVSNLLVLCGLCHKKIHMKVR